MLNSLEKKLGRFAIKNLIYYVLGGYAIGYILVLFDSQLGLYNYITLEPAMVMQGQVWRLFTWVLTPPQGLSFFVIFMFLLYFFIGRTLENVLGAFRYNIYMLSGWFFMTLGAMAMYWITDAVSGTGISMNVSTYYINLASFLAFAVLFPDTRVYFFGIIPIKMKILAIIDIAYLALQVVSGVVTLLALPNPDYAEIFDMFGLENSYTFLLVSTEIFSIIISLLNFLIFFLMNRKFKGVSRTSSRPKAQYTKSYRNTSQSSGGFYAGSGSAQQTKEAEKPKKPVYRPAGGSDGLVHVCSVCGRTSREHPDLTFRFCSKCEGNHEYCQDHLFTHVHIK
ncbi:MAG: hypothetical protein HUJ75_08950 [Parasporobacterium sp.]|nr:hypothetical protein [Parasporobacterium sp.]